MNVPGGSMSVGTTRRVLVTRRLTIGTFAWPTPTLSQAVKVMFTDGLTVKKDPVSNSNDTSTDHVRGRPVSCTYESRGESGEVAGPTSSLGEIITNGDEPPQRIERRACTR